MGWQELASMRRLAETHLQAWQEASTDVRMMLERLAPEERPEKLEQLQPAGRMMAELQEQERLWGSPLPKAGLSFQMPNTDKAA